MSFRLLAVLLLVTGVARAQSAPAPRDNNARGVSVRPDSSAPARPFSITNPVPHAQLRELSTDRPDRTESPYTVDVGHLQFEMDVVNMTDDRRDGARVQSFGIGALNAKVGLRHNIDLQIVTQFVTLERNRTSTAAHTSTTPVSDFTARLKINFWGNDGGSTAFAIMPYITAPTNTRGLGLNAAEGGIILPLGLDLGGGWGMGVMSELDIVHQDDGRRYQLSALHSATVSHDLFGPFGAYVELVGEIAAARGAHLLATGDAGITVGVTPDLQLDLGANIGLTKSTERATVFVGISKRY